MNEEGLQKQKAIKNILRFSAILLGVAVFSFFASCLVLGEVTLFSPWFAFCVTTFVAFVMEMIHPQYDPENSNGRPILIRWVICIYLGVIWLGSMIKPSMYFHSAEEERAARLRLFLLYLPHITLGVTALVLSLIHSIANKLNSRLTSTKSYGITVICLSVAITALGIAFYQSRSGMFELFLLPFTIILVRYGICCLEKGRKTKKEEEAPARKVEFSLRKPLTLNFIGDSITWGLNHCSAEETYVAEFARLFAKKFTEYKVVRYDGTVETEALPLTGFEGPFFVGGTDGGPEAAIIRNGVGGNTVRRALNRKQDFTGALAGGRPADVNFLMFGINDALASDKSKYVTPDKFEKDYEELLSLLKAEGAVIIILSPTYNGLKYPLDQYAAVTEKLAWKHGLPFIDTHKLWMEHYSKKAPRFGQGDWLSESKTDACHFSPEGARQTAKFIFDKFCSELLGE